MSDCPRKPNEVRIRGRLFGCVGSLQQNRAKIGLARGQSNAATHQNEHVNLAKPNMKARKLQANPNIVQIAPRLT